MIATKHAVKHRDSRAYQKSVSDRHSMNRNSAQKTRDLRAWKKINKRNARRMLRDMSKELINDEI